MTLWRFGHGATTMAAIIITNLCQNFKQMLPERVLESAYQVELLEQAIIGKLFVEDYATQGPTSDKDEGRV
jgi:hypothetical protein